MSKFKPGPVSPLELAARRLLTQAAELRQLGRFADSAKPMLKAATLFPENASIRHDLGLTYLQAGQPSLAAAEFVHAIRIKPSFAEAHWRLGLAYELLSDPPKAMVALQRSVELKPALWDAHYRLAHLLVITGRQSRAHEIFSRLSAEAPPGELRDLAQIRSLLLAKMVAEAQTALEAAAIAHPRNSVVQEMLGTMLSEAGEFLQAEVCFRRALRLNPGAVETYYDLVRCRRIGPQDGELLQAMEAAAIRPASGPHGAIKLQLALGKAFDDLGDHARAMAAFDAADDVRQGLVNFDLTLFNNVVDWCIETFSKARLEALAPQGHHDRTPVFIVGMPRSGTTLCEQILSSHTAVAGAGELHFWERRGRMLLAGEAAMFGEQAFAKAGADFVSVLRQFSPDAERITDKMPTNFLWLGLIHAALPAATIIHCRRSALDTALSIHQTFFSPQRPFPTGGEALVEYYRAYKRMMRHWSEVLPADRFMEIDYETLVTDPERVTRTIVSKISMPWDDHCLNPQNNPRRVATASKWQARQPVYQTAVDRWRSYEPFLGALSALKAE